MYFEEMTKETLYIAQEIINSNPGYNVLENKKGHRSLAEMEKEFLGSDTFSAFIKLEDTYIGVIDYLIENPKDRYPWLGLLMIHNDYQGYGFGTQAYALYENEMMNRGLGSVRLGVLKDNTKAHSFWESQGFVLFKKTTSQSGNEIWCYEKHIG